MGGLCIDSQVDYGDTRCERSLIYPVLAWDFKQGVKEMNAKCHVTSIHTTHVDQCVPIVGTIKLINLVI